MENSVESYINAQPEQAISLQEFWQANGGTQDITDPQNKFANLFTGKIDKIKNMYQTYLENLNKRNEWLANQSARAWDLEASGSQIQRLLKDYEAAGLNPYLLINNGSLSSGSAPTSAKADYKHSSQKEEKKSNTGRDLALLLIGVARLAAALL